MEYTKDEFLSDSGSLTLRLCRLMTSFDETAAVVPYRSAKAVSRYDLWLVPMTDGRRVVTKYVGGIHRVSEGFRLYLRHRAATAEDIFKAEGILIRYVKRLSDFLLDTDGFTLEEGALKRVATDGTVWEFFAEFTLFTYEVTPVDGALYYVSFDNEAPVPIGVGCTLFREYGENVLHARRYFDGDALLYRKTGECRSVDFEFETTVKRCALAPIFYDKQKVTLYTVFPDGRGEMARYELSELYVTDALCKGKLMRDGEAVSGIFNSETGEFTCEGSVSV